MTERQRGGVRPGAGRKPGGANKKTREIADRAARKGITPLEVMLEAMHDAYQKAGAIAAFPFAKDTAPYLHAKMAAVEVTGKDGGPLEVAHNIQELTDEQLADIATGRRT